MPFIGLIITSIGFAVPCVIAWRRRRVFDAYSSGLLTLTSVAYHGTLHPICKNIDMCVAHVIGVLSVPRSIFRVVFVRRHWKEGVVFIGTLGAIAVYWYKSRNNPYESARQWHVLFHLMCQGTWVTHLLSIQHPEETRGNPNEIMLVKNKG